MITTLDNGAQVPIALDRCEPFTEPAPWGDPRAHGWTVTLRNYLSGVTLTVPFWTGAALRGHPTAADVLDCLTAEASYIDDAGGPEADPLTIMGHLYREDLLPDDGQAAAAAVRAMIDNARGLRSLLSHWYGAAVWGEVEA